MRCPNCDSENNDSAKFCKKCGTSLEKKVTSHESMINSMNEKTSSNNTTKYIIVALIIVAVVLAGAFIYLYGFGSNQTCPYWVEASPQEEAWRIRPTLQYMWDLNTLVKMLKYRYSTHVTAAP